MTNKNKHSDNITIIRKGYIKSFKSQSDIQVQKEILEKAGCTIIYKDIIETAKTQRPGLETLIESLNKEDTLVIHSLDKLGSSMNQVIDALDKVQDRGAHLQSLTENIDTNSKNDFFAAISFLKQSKDILFQLQTQTGRTGAKARGRMGGRPEKISDKEAKKIKEAYENNLPIREICEKHGISRPTLYKYIKRA